MASATTETRRATWPANVSRNNEMRKEDKDNEDEAAEGDEDEGGVADEEVAPTTSRIKTRKEDKTQTANGPSLPTPNSS